MKRNKINHTSATLMKTAKIMIRAEGTVRDEITAAQRVGVAVPSLGFEKLEMEKLKA